MKKPGAWSPHLYVRQGYSHNHPRNQPEVRTFLSSPKFSWVTKVTHEPCPRALSPQYSPSLLLSFPYPSLGQSSKGTVGTMMASYTLQGSYCESHCTGENNEGATGLCHLAQGQRIINSRKDLSDFTVAPSGQAASVIWKHLLTLPLILQRISSSVVVFAL